MVPVNVHVFMLAQYRPVGGRLSNQEMRTCRSSKINPSACSLLYLRNTICAWNNSNLHIKQRTLGKRIYCTAVLFFVFFSFLITYMTQNLLLQTTNYSKVLFTLHSATFPNFLQNSHLFLPNRQSVNCQWLPTTTNSLPSLHCHIG